MEIVRAVSVVDTHTCGEPTRIILGGGPWLPGATTGEKWLSFRRDFDDFRSFVMCEPRGHGDMFGALLLPPSRPDAHFGVIFMDSGSSVAMCGHGSVGIARTVVELGILPRKEPETEVVLDSPAGLVHLAVAVKDGRVGDVRMTNVPAFVFERHVRVEVPSIGREIELDVSFGGNFFAIVPAQQLGLSLIPEETPKLVHLGLEIRDAVNRKLQARHPIETHIEGVELVEFSLERESAPTRNVVIFGKGSVDRSPCGTGTCAKMALLAAKGMLAPGETFLHESITDSVFKGSYAPGPKVGAFESVVPTIESRSYVTGYNILLQQADDPLGKGFFLGR